MLKHFLPGLLPPIGAESYEQVVAGYRELFSNHERPNSHALQRHLIEGILPGLAFCQILREGGKPQEDALGTEGRRK